MIEVDGWQLVDQDPHHLRHKHYRCFLLHQPRASHNNPINNSTMDSTRSICNKTVQEHGPSPALTFESTHEARRSPVTSPPPLHCQYTSTWHRAKCCRGRSDVNQGGRRQQPTRDIRWYSRVAMEHGCSLLLDLSDWANPFRSDGSASRRPIKLSKERELKHKSRYSETLLTCSNVDWDKT